MRFEDTSQVWSQSAMSLHRSLFSLLNPGQEIVFNAVALVSNPETNKVGVNILHYNCGITILKSY